MHWPRTRTASWSGAFVGTILCLLTSTAFAFHSTGALLGSNGARRTVASTVLPGVDSARSGEEIMEGRRTGDEIGAPIDGADALEVIAQNWVSCAASSIPLETRNNTYYFEETYSVEVVRDGGLGLILGEMWGAQNGDDSGLVLIEEVVKGSNADLAGGIAVGDTILGVYGEDGIASGVTTEGKNWDATIGALTSVPGDAVTLIMKRLVRRARMNVHVTASDGTDLGSFNCPSGANLRMEFLRRGLPQEEIYDMSTMRFDAIGNAGSK